MKPVKDHHFTSLGRHAHDESELRELPPEEAPLENEEK